MPISCAEWNRSAMPFSASLFHKPSELLPDFGLRRHAPIAAAGSNPTASASSFPGGCQIQQPRLWNAFGKAQPGEVYPALRTVKHDAVGRGDDLAGMRQDVVGAEGQF